jgi:hypothetical protein
MAEIVKRERNPVRLKWTIAAGIVVAFLSAATLLGTPVTNAAGAPKTSREASGWCVSEFLDLVRFQRCPPWAKPRVVGTTPALLDTDPEQPFGPVCPPTTDRVIRPPFEPSQAFLCVDA